jgi:deoxyribonuclease-4
MTRRPAQRIGFHVSIAGGLHKGVANAVERNCTAMQVFCGNPRGWPMRERCPEEIAAFRGARAQADLFPVVVHACYLINPCAVDRSIFRRGIRRLAAELELAAAIGAEFYVLHPGSCKGKSADWAVRRAAEGISGALLRAAAAPLLLLEDTASAYGPGGDFAALGELSARIRQSVPTAELGLAVDSCHVWGAGYDLRRTDEVARMADDIERSIGLDALRLIHLNDSRDACASRRDRHEHLGKGAIGRRGLLNLLSHPAGRSQPLILETPWESIETDRRNMRTALDLLREATAR